MTRTGVAFGCVFGLVLAVSGCSGADPAPVPSSAAPTSSASGVEGPPTQEVPNTEPAVPELALPAGVGVDVEYRGVPIHIEIAPIQVKDGAALLSVDYSLANDAPQTPRILIGQILMPPSGPMGVSTIRLVDGANSQVHLIGKDGDKQPATSRDPLALEPGKSVHSDAFFGAPAGETVDVLFPYFGLVQGVPVVQAPEALTVTPDDLSLVGELTYQTTPMDAFVVAFDDSSTTRSTGTDVKVSLASDVLFAVDKSTLTAKAQKVVDRAATKIAAVAAGGEVSVVGHTDDVGSEAYNQKLSVKRAKAVVAQLSKTLDKGFTLSAEGRGKSEPAAEGQSKEARAANRRVEIRFQAKKAGTAVDVGASSAKAPKQTGKVVAMGTPVSVPVRDKEFTVEAISVRRAGAHLVGSLRVTGASPQPIQMIELFGTATQGLAAKRGLKMTTMVAGAHNLTLLGEASRFYPADYVTVPRDGLGSDQRATLADQFLSAELEQGQSVVVTAMWPDPGGDTVTIDVPERFRITDVPVTP